MKILLLAGEESGVMYAERIRAEILKSRPDAEFRGYADSGFRTGDLAVMGFWAVLKRIFFFLRVKRTMERVIDDWRPDVVCTVDYPGLNLKLAAFAKARGIRAVHVVCPQVWAWKKGRIPKIEAALDRLCCFFPFEPKYFKPGFAVFVGHPLVDEFGRSGKVEWPVRTGKTLAVLPGSRLGEIEKHLPVLLEIVETLQREIPELDAVVPAANDRAYEAISRIRHAFHAASAQRIRVTRGGAREALCAADAAVVASGTATLEAALAGCPTALVYRVSAALAWFARRVIREIHHIGLANVIAEKAGVPPPMPELLQEEFTAQNVCRVLRPWLTDVAKRSEAAAALTRTMRLLQSDGGAMARIAREITIAMS